MPLPFLGLPDGRLLVVSGRLLLRREPDGSLVTHADLSGLPGPGCNEIVVDGRGNAYINGPGFDLLAGEQFKPGIVALVTPAGSVRQVADGIAFPNGMVVTPDNSTLILAESYGKRLTAFDIAADGSLSNRRVWADLDGGVPDGICLDADNAVWYGDVPNKRCVRVREGGEVLQTIYVDRGCFACMLSERDRLLAAGLLSFIVAFLLVGWGDTRSIRALMNVGVFATASLLFSKSPLRCGPSIERLLAILFMLPPVIFVVILVGALISHEVVR